MNELKLPKVGFVVIGRNEAPRLARCLQSIPGVMGPTVYVDSESHDGSPDIAASLGVPVVALCPKTPMSAARARNAGFDWLTQRYELDFVQFLDGDTDLCPGWIGEACAHLEGAQLCGLVFGHRSERDPAAHIYNRLAEWDCAVHRRGRNRFAGDALVRVQAFDDCGGFTPALIAGEEADLCRRLERSGWRIDRLEVDMTRHDMNMTSFSQWWQRMRRGGFAYAQNAMARPREPGATRQSLSALVWGLGLPFGALIVAGFALWPISVAFLLLYPLNLLRMANRYGVTQRTSWERAAFVVLGKTPEAMGVLDYLWQQVMGVKRGLIEYK